MSDKLTTEESICRTVVCKLETSNRKNERLRSVIDVWQDILAYVSEMYPSIDKDEWGDARPTHLRRLIGEQFEEVFDNRLLYKHCADETTYKLAGMYDSWLSNDHDQDRPSFDGDGDWFRTPGKYLTIEPNDRGYGLELKLRPYRDPEWFHMNVSEHQEQYIEKILDGNGRLGSTEIHLRGDQPFAHIPVTYDVTVYDPETVSRRVGVDVGENVLYTIGVLDNGGVQQVEMESGREFRHHREELSRRRDQKQRQGKLQQVKSLKGQRRRYTEHVLGNAASEIVDIAVEHEPCAITIEDMTGYRQSATDPIHDFPFAAFQQRICETATARGIPVESVDPSMTSQTCRHCDGTNTSRGGHDFTCHDCGYEVHADVNGAINIARRGRGSF